MKTAFRWKAVFLCCLFPFLHMHLQEGCSLKKTYRKKERAGVRWLWVTVLGLIGTLAVTTMNSLDRITVQTGSLETHVQTIVLDAGHGGEDGGSVSADGVLEKDINLAIAQKLKPLLESSGIRVIMVREEDVSIGDQTLDTVRERKVSDLHNRLKLVEEHPDCLLVSIHQNHFCQSQYWGTQLFYSPNCPESQQLAESIQGSVVQYLQPENRRECKPAGNTIYLLWNAQVPAVIVECGFLSNPSETALLQKEEYQMQMAVTLWNGILNYLEK